MQMIIKNNEDQPVVIETELSDVIVWGDEQKFSHYCAYYLDWWSFTEQERLDLLKFHVDNEEDNETIWHNCVLICDLNDTSFKLLVVDFCFDDADEILEVITDNVLPMYEVDIHSSHYKETISA